MVESRERGEREGGETRRLWTTVERCESSGGGEEQEEMNGGPYSESFKSQIVSRLMGPRAKTATALSKEVGISQATLSRWLKEARTVSGRMSEKDESRQGDRDRSRRRAQDWTPQEKLRVVLQSMTLSEDELGAFLRREGLHEAQLKEWREAATDALEEPRSAGKRKKETKRVRQLEKEIQRKDRALAEAAALLVLQKKVQTLWGDADDDTDEESEK